MALPQSGARSAVGSSDNQLVRRWSSEDGRRTYALTLRWPDAVAPATGFPVVIMLDGAWVADAAARAGADAAVALLTHEGDDETVRAARAFDFTPPLAGGGLLADPRTPRWRNGGADAFLALLREAILPWVAAQVPVDPARVSLFGHSYGALCILRGLYAGMLGSVDRCVLASPSVWWHDGAVDEALPSGGAPGPAVLFLAGEHERWHAQAVGPDGTADSREGGRLTLAPIQQAAARWSATGAHEVYLAVVPQGTHHSMLAQSVAPAFEFARQPRAALSRIWRPVDRWEHSV